MTRRQALFEYRADRFAMGQAEALALADQAAIVTGAPFVLARAAFPHMRQIGHGTIVSVSSVAGKRGWANAAAYCASKFGLTG